MVASPARTVLGPWGLYAIVDPDHCARRDPVALARTVLESGAGILQLRCKTRDVDELIPLGRALKELCEQFGVPFIANDFPRLALETGADGLHVGQADATVAQARALLGPGRIIGLSTHNREQALAGESSGADYLGFGPIFSTRTKEKAEAALGLDEARWAARTLRRPFVAIGGVTPENLPQLARCGVRNAAAVSAIFAAEDAGAAARAFVRILKEGASGERGAG